MKQTEEINELARMCAGIAKKGEKPPVLCRVWRYRSAIDEIYVTFSETAFKSPSKVTVWSVGRRVFIKTLNGEDAEVSVPEPEGWEHEVRGLYAYLVLREVEVDGCVISL